MPYKCHLEESLKFKMLQVTKQIKKEIYIIFLHERKQTLHFSAVTT